MSIKDCFNAYGLHSIHIKSNPSGDGLTWIPIVSDVNGSIDDEAWEDINEAILDDILDDRVLTGGDYDFMCGSLTLEENTVTFSGAQTRELTVTKVFT